jgi:hypothetical protein
MQHWNQNKTNRHRHSVFLKCFFDQMLDLDKSALSGVNWEILFDGHGGTIA